VDNQWTPPNATLGPGQPPHIISRAEWGAGKRIPFAAGRTTGRPVRARGGARHRRRETTIRLEDSAAILRSIYAYHTVTLGWCDIAYNALVDKYGQVFEGRAGGITKDVMGSGTPAASTATCGACR
jgi:uncharacterized protein with LGFP repeats